MDLEQIPEHLRFTLKLNLELEDLIQRVQQENATERRCRELSLAITHLEEASHWMSAQLARLSDTPLATKGGK